MGSRDVSRWVFKLTADPICPPLIPEWYLSLLEFYIVSSVSKSVLALSQIVILLRSNYLISLQFLEWSTNSTPNCFDFLTCWRLLMELHPGALFPILPMFQSPSGMLITVHAARSVVPLWLYFVAGKGPGVKIIIILMGICFLLSNSFKNYFKEQNIKIQKMGALRKPRTICCSN